MSQSWSVGDTGLAYNSGEGAALLYHVKVLEIKRVNKRARHLVHFQRWSSKYDEWVDDVLPASEENVALMNELQEKFAVQRAEEKALLAAERAAEKRELKAKMGSAPLLKKRRLMLAGGASEGEGSSGSGMSAGLLRLSLPAPLKKQLFEDMEAVAVHKRLVKLPRRVTAETVLYDFIAESSEPFGLCSAMGKVSRETVQQIVSGLLLFFDRALGSSLLYQFERLQFQAMRERYPEDFEAGHLVTRPNSSHQGVKRLSQVYGCEHLLRLLARLHELVVAIELMEHEADTLVLVLNTLLKFLAKNKDKYLVHPSDYTPASRDYIHVSQDL